MEEAARVLCDGGEFRARSTTRVLLGASVENDACLSATASKGDHDQEGRLLPTAPGPSISFSIRRTLKRSAQRGRKFLVYFDNGEARSNLLAAAGTGCVCNPAAGLYA